METSYQLYKKGLAALAAGRADEAIVPLERAKVLEPESMSIYEALGKTYLTLGFFERAITEFSVILENEPLDAYAHYCIGRAYDRLRRRTLARRHYRLAASFAPERRIYMDTLNAFLKREFPADGPLTDPDELDRDMADGVDS